MNFNRLLLLKVLIISINARLHNIKSNASIYNTLNDHTMVTDSDVFPYVVAILKRTTYLSAGALIDDNWVLTGADALFLMRESFRTIRVRLGSINYKKGGTLLPIKFLEIHPFFDDSKPEYDLALIRLPVPVQFNPSLNSIRMLKNPKHVTATHFIVTSWLPGNSQKSEEPRLQEYMEDIKRRHILSVTHLHPSDPEDCSEELQSIGIQSISTVMCLEPDMNDDQCSRDVGAPVVLNGVLWGIFSSWRPENCAEELPGPSFVSLVSAPEISSWIHSTVRGHRWSFNRTAIDNKPKLA